MLSDRLKSLLNNFSDIKKKTIIQYYKNVPISHIRLNKPYYYNNIDARLKNYQISDITSVINMYIDIVEKYHPGVDIKNFNIAVQNLNLTTEETTMWNHVTQWCMIMLFERNINCFEKFNDPVIVSRDTDDLTSMDIHPGRNRVRALEYLYLKNKKEYYIDVIFYREKKHQNLYDGFLVDKEPIVIKSFQEFIKLYGYDSISNLINDLPNIKISTTNPIGQIWIAKSVGYTKEDYKNKLIELKEILEKSQ
jgi:hypothetical protein